VEEIDLDFAHTNSISQNMHVRYGSYLKLNKGRKGFCPMYKSSNPSGTLQLWSSQGNRRVAMSPRHALTGLRTNFNSTSTAYLLHFDVMV
jgi:hypothetical protein